MLHPYLLFACKCLFPGDSWFTNSEALLYEETLHWSQEMKQICWQHGLRVGFKIWLTFTNKSCRTSLYLSKVVGFWCKPVCLYFIGTYIMLMLMHVCNKVKRSFFLTIAVLFGTHTTMAVCLFVTLFDACHILWTMHARVLKFHIWIPHGKIADCIFFLVRVISLSGVMLLWKNQNEILSAKYFENYLS